jgi:hypothetical protein
VTGDREAAVRLLAKLRRLVDEELDPEERVLLGVCLAPAVIAATKGREATGLSARPVGDEALIEFMRSDVRRSNLYILDRPTTSREPRRRRPPSNRGSGGGISPMWSSVAGQ